MKLSTSRRPRSARTVVKSGFALVVASLLFAACGSSDGDSSSGEELPADELAALQASADEIVKEPTEIGQTTPLSKPAPSGKFIVMMQDGNPVSVDQFKGVADAAESLGWTSQAIKFDPTDISTFNTGLIQALSLGADYVVDSGVPESQISKSTLDKYEAAGVPIIVLDSVPIPTDEPLHGLPAGPNSREIAGTKLADWFVADSKGKGHILNVNVTTYPVLTLFADSFDEEVAKVCPSCKTTPLKVTYDDLVDGTLTGKIIAALRGDKSIKYVVLDNSSENGGLDAALQSAGLTDVSVIGHSIDPTTVESIGSGQSKAFIAYNFTYNGWDAVDAAARLSVGDPPGSETGATPFRLITEDNVSEIGDDAVYRGPDDALQQFQALWLVPAS